jgi:hypothetical protein
MDKIFREGLMVGLLIFALLMFWVPFTVGAGVVWYKIIKEDIPLE